MFFSICLYSALAVFTVGMLYRLYAWFYKPMGHESWPLSGAQRCGQSFAAFFRALFSPRIGKIILAFVFDVLLQGRLLKESFWRWLGHILIFGGFMALLLMHAMESLISFHLFNDYQPTLSPYLELRNIFGLAVIVGLIIVLVRRVTTPVLKRTGGGPDWVAIVLLGIILASGFFLEAAKIISQPIYQEMVNDFAALDGPGQEKALKAYWARDFGVVFKDVKGPFDKNLLAEGAALSADNCASCHQSPKSALISWPLSRIMAPAGTSLNAIRFDRILWYIHFVGCMLGLAYLPFSKFLHIITTPLALLVRAALDEEQITPGVRASKRALELDSCTHCAICSEHCSVAPILRKIPNLAILPSEKLALSRQMDRLSREELLALAEGSYICTSCLRCTGLCPAGLNLQELWFALKDELRRRGIASNYEWARGQATGGALGQPRSRQDAVAIDSDSAAQQHDYSYCFRCHTCTNSCPVVKSFDDPKEHLGLLPHQIMHALALGLKDEAMSAAMTWDCLTCYNCQENCPQEIPVADLLYDLRAQAFASIKKTGT